MNWAGKFPWLFFYEIEVIIVIIIIIIIIIILIWHLNKLLVIWNDSGHKALFLLILLDYLYIYFFTWIDELNRQT